MQRTQKLSRIIIVILSLSLIFISNSVVSEETGDIINTDIRIEMKSGTNLSIETELSVVRFSLEASGTTYTNEDIKNNIDGTETMGAIKYALRSILLSQIRETFKNAEIRPINELPSYQNEKFHDEFQASLSSSFFGMNESINSYELINGILDLGAQVNYSFDLKAEKGWNNTYTINLGGNTDHIIFTNGKANNKNIEWTVFNWNGEKPSEEAILKVKKSDPTTSPKEEEITLGFELDTRQKQNKFETNINLEVIDITNYSFLPSFITNLDYASSDGIRLFIKNNMIDWSEIVYKKTIKNIVNKIKETIEDNAFNQTLDLVFEYDQSTTSECNTPFELYKMDTEPPIIGNVKDGDIEIKIYDISSRALFGLINTGGTANISKEDINFGKNLDKIGYPYNITIFLPENVLLNGNNEYTWNDTIDFKGIMKSDSTPYYHQEEINSVIEMDIKDSDLNLLGFFTGNPEINLGINVVETKNYNITRLPDEFSLPNEIKIDYLNSDALRLCIKEKVFTEGKLQEFLENIKKSFEQRISNIISNLNVDGNINRNIVDENTEKKVNISNMDSQPPFKTEMYSDAIIPVKYSFSFLPPSFEIPTQSYSFEGIKNQTVIYRIFFPKGVEVILNDSLNKAEIKETKDNREYLEISFSPDEYNLTSDISYKIKLSPMFLVGLFVPCITSFVIVLALIIVIFILRRKGKYKKPTTVRDEEDSDYKDEEYYVPPPPGSK